MKTLYSICLFIISIISSSKLSACDGGSFTLNASTYKGGGITEYCFNIDIDIGNSGPADFGFVLEFNSFYNTPNVVNYPTTINNAQLTNGAISTPFQGLVIPSINSIANDAYFAIHTISPNAASYEGAQYEPGNDPTFDLCIDVSGCVESVRIYSKLFVGNNPTCEYDVSIGSCAPPCNCGDINTDCAGLEYSDETTAVTAYNSVILPSTECTDLSSSSLTVEDGVSVYTFCHEFSPSDSGEYGVNSQVGVVSSTSSGSPPPCQDNTSLTTTVYETNNQCSSQPSIDNTEVPTGWLGISLDAGSSYQICTEVGPFDADCCGIVEAVCTYIYPLETCDNPVRFIMD